MISSCKLCICYCKCKRQFTMQGLWMTLVMQRANALTLGVHLSAVIFMLLRGGRQWIAWIGSTIRGSRLASTTSRWWLLWCVPLKAILVQADLTQADNEHQGILIGWRENHQSRTSGPSLDSGCKTSCPLFTPKIFGTILAQAHLPSCVFNGS